MKNIQVGDIVSFKHNQTLGYIVEIDFEDENDEGLLPIAVMPLSFEDRDRYIESWWEPKHLRKASDSEITEFLANSLRYHLIEDFKAVV